MKTTRFPVPALPPGRHVFAFTLIELLTVIAIIGILAAIIIPTVGRVRSSARQAHCQSNARQLAASLLLYASENRSNLPAIWIAQDNDWLKVVWSSLYLSDFPYTSEKERLRGSIFQCPSSPDKNGEPSVGYGMNRDVTRTEAGALKQHEPTALSRIQNPSRTCLVIDNGNQVAGGDGPSSTRFTELKAAVKDRHGGRASVAFYDGHVAALTLEEIPSRYDTDDGKIFWRGD